MWKKFFFPTLFSFLALCTQFPFSERVHSQGSDWKPMSPILDNSVDPSLRFAYCNGAVQTINKDILTRVGFSKQKAKEFKSQKVTQMQERWLGVDRSVEIYRWYLSTPEDAAAFVCTEFIAIPVIWNKTPDIGDKTSYCGGHAIYFTKGNVLVKVFLNSLADDKEYLKKIALSVAKNSDIRFKGGR